MPVRTTVTRPSGRVIELPFWCGAIMGEPGAGKTHFAASFPKPILVIATDPQTKMQPYFDHGVGAPEERTGTYGQPVWLVRDAAGKVIIQIEGFYDTDMTMQKSAMTDMVSRFGSVVQEVKADHWRTVVLDSWSGFEDCARERRLAGPMKCHNPDGRAHHNIAKEDCKQIFRMQLIHLPCNVVIVFHVSQRMEEGAGVMLYAPKTIGDFHITVGQNLAERYLAEALPDGTRRQMKTRPDGRYKLTTLIDAPSPCENNYAAIWNNFILKHDKDDAASIPPAAPTDAKAASPTS